MRGSLGLFISSHSHHGITVCTAVEPAALHLLQTSPALPCSRSLVIDRSQSWLDPAQPLLQEKRDFCQQLCLELSCSVCKTAVLETISRC